LRPQAVSVAPTRRRLARINNRFRWVAGASTRCLRDRILSHDRTGPHLASSPPDGVCAEPPRGLAAL